MLTKKRLAAITAVMALVCFCVLFFLPQSVMGKQRAESLPAFIFNIALLSATVAITIAIIIIPICKKGFLKGQIIAFNRYKYLLQLLVKRDFVSKYRKSVLGVLWSLLRPLLMMLVTALVFSTLFSRSIENYPVYLISAHLIFDFFTESTKHSMSSIIRSEGLIKKVYIPKYIFPLSKVLSSLLNLVFMFCAFLFVFLVTRAPFHWTILLIPIPLIYTFVFSLGISLLLSSLAVFFRDLTYLYDVFIRLLTYLTPMFYPVSIIPAWLMPYYSLNPMYHFVSYFRDLAMYGVIPGVWENLICMGFALAALSVGIYVFMAQKDRYILNL